jgi:hypothetical protein
MKNLKWLFSLYPDFSSRAVIVGEFLFDRKAYLSRLAIEQRFAFRSLVTRWSMP